VNSKHKSLIALTLVIASLLLIFLTSNLIDRSNSQAFPTAWSTIFPLPTVPKGFPTSFPPSESHYYSGNTYKISNYLITTWDSEQLNNRQAVTISSPNQAQITVSDWDVSLGRIHHLEYDPQKTPEWFQENVSEDINNDGAQEIVITTSKGGNNGYYTIFVYSLGEQIELVLNRIYFGFYRFQDLNDDGVLEILLKQGVLSKFLPSSSLGRFFPVTEILEYVPPKGYTQASCKFSDFYKQDMATLENALKSDGNKDTTIIYRLAIYYSYIGKSELAAKIIDEQIPQEDISNAKIVLNELQEGLKSELCP
jgi:hypothetical protein